MNCDHFAVSTSDADLEMGQANIIIILPSSSTSFTLLQYVHFYDDET